MTTTKMICVVDSFTEEVDAVHCQQEHSFLPTFSPQAICGSFDGAMSGELRLFDGRVIAIPDPVLRSMFSGTGFE